MTLGDLYGLLPFAQLSDNVTGCMLLVVIGMSLIKISPVNLDPWAMLGAWIQKVIGVKALSDRMEKKDAMDARTRILRFDDECINLMRHSREMFEAVLIDCDDYLKYCESHPGFKNSIADEAIGHVKTVYRRCKEENDFLVVRKDS